MQYAHSCVVLNGGHENQMDVDYNIDLQLEYWQVACNNVQMMVARPY